MKSPLSMRLTEEHPENQIEFNSDIDGWVRIYQEVDEKQDDRVAVRWKHTVDPRLPPSKRFLRQIQAYVDKVTGLVAE